MDPIEIWCAAQDTTVQASNVSRKDATLQPDLNDAEGATAVVAETNPHSNTKFAVSGTCALRNSVMIRIDLAAASLLEHYPAPSPELSSHAHRDTLEERTCSDSQNLGRPLRKEQESGLTLQRGFRDRPQHFGPCMKWSEPAASPTLSEETKIRESTSSAIARRRVQSAAEAFVTTEKARRKENKNAFLLLAMSLIWPPPSALNR